MSADPEKNEELPEDEAEQQEAGPEAAAEAEAAAEPGEADPVEALAAENAELKDRLMRALAEVENVRRRADKERQDAAKFGPSGLAKELLAVADNLGRALQSVTDEDREASASVKNLVVGVEMIEKQFVDAFERFHIKRIDPLGEKFSYEKHQAISEATDTGQPAGTIVQVLQPGYMMHERLLRPAMVVVAKGDSDAVPPEGHASIDTTA
ncbi:nucleotide exchange factor GrpE [Hwanghaeella grinnelliae]|uniref:Protein GrpE n=1 Tax=Hwanghaeella grinnelliae TaxID=2500179 RepID=A0A3S3UNK5_9PROT|nr:nucleotide exchange factor GrpE [Hwanghaeella grinnelliae]RVU36186.1 nucleotide exchange factor GrpE [Hwanghaeella grinnelliae]